MVGNVRLLTVFEVLGRKLANYFNSACFFFEVQYIYILEGNNESLAHLVHGERTFENINKLEEE